MGTLIYNGRTSIPLDDRTLAHLQVVFISKLRRRESFAFTAAVDGRQVVTWIGPSVALEFLYTGSRHPVLNRDWLELLAQAAASTDGLFVVPEPREHSAQGTPASAPAATRPRRVPVSA